MSEYTVYKHRPTTNRISCGVNLSGISAENLREYIKRGVDINHEAGFDALDFSTGLIRFAPDDYLDIMAEVKEYAAEKDLRFEVVHLPFGVTPSTDAERLERFNESVYRAIDAAAVLKPDAAVMHPIATSEVVYSADPKLNYERDVAHLAPFVEYAEKKGVRIVVENMRLAVENYKRMAGYMPLTRNCHTPEELCRVVDTLGVGICWDFGHAHICHLKQSDSLKYIGSRLKVTHVCDNFGYDDEHLPPFFGTINWTDVAEGLKAINYGGLFNYEINGNKLPLASRRTYAKYLVTCAEEILAK